MPEGEPAPQSSQRKFSSEQAAAWGADLAEEEHFNAIVETPAPGILGKIPGVKGLFEKEEMVARYSMPKDAALKLAQDRAAQLAKEGKHVKPVAKPANQITF